MRSRSTGGRSTSTAPPDTPLLWVLREELKLTGTKFGCGIGQCGACMVHVDGERAFSCLTPVVDGRGPAVTTIEGLSADASHPVQKAWIAEQVPQCGYCQSGQIMSAADCSRTIRSPTRDEIVEHMSTQYLPLRHLSAHRQRDRARGAGGLSHDDHDRSRALNRRSFMVGAAGLTFALAIAPRRAR